jgi:hypothetical protein
VACGAVLAIPALAIPAVAAGPAAAAVTPADQFRGVSCPADRFCLGVGWYIPSGGVKRPLAERWDGSAWHAMFPLVPSPAPASVLQAVSCVSPSSCLAVGDTNTSGDHGPVFGKLFAEKWNGSTWRMVPVADPGRATLTKVSCPGPRNCYAAGWTGTRQSVSQRALIEHWDGARWSTRPLPGTPRNSVLRSVACPARTRCTAVGAAGFDSPRMLVEDLRGGRWHASVLSRKAVNPGNLGLDDVSCRAPRVCSAADLAAAITPQYSGRRQR